MRSTFIGRLVAYLYPKLPLRRVFLSLAAQREGGDFYSTTLRYVLSQHHRVEVGEYSYGSLLRPGAADPGTRIGRYVSIGPNVRRLGAAHPLDHLSLHPFCYSPRLGYAEPDDDVERSECMIESEVWIGANVVILPGCQRIGFGAVIGAGAIVTRDVPDFAVAVGNPARVITTRLDERQRAWLMDQQPWNLDPAEFTRVMKASREL
ncbi:MAG: CatB-related O-acetyltransferase [Aeromicrobium sp.]|uniref:CatB-related O-acetyltransferase n=1 Tax=Aeromicrobium sp. TaxID=1871063 RepID=UPI0026204DBB|nr:CatB-related O-acetyltransferase [Aeromicrobium sp.]MDF1706239.1 CatB-related O-acetyltransferase [Aeromicrobium sp.]